MKSAPMSVSRVKAAEGEVEAVVGEVGVDLMIEGMADLEIVVGVGEEAEFVYLFTPSYQS